MKLSIYHRLFGSKLTKLSRLQVTPQVRLNVEPLEGRWVPATLHVGSQVGEFTTIQAAIDQANPGDLVLVDPGTYQEQLNISTNSNGVALDNLIIRSVAGSTGTTIQLPSTAPASQTTAIVEVTGAQNVTINGFTVSGPGNGSGSGSIGYGIEYDGGSTGTIINDTVTQIEDNPRTGTQNGTGIQIGNSSTDQTASVSVMNDVVEDYQKNGISVSNTGSSATVENNTVIGIGPNSTIGQNGIEVVFGANAQVLNNRVTGNIFTPATAAASGILLFEPGTVKASFNTVTNNDVGIYVFDASGERVGGNILTGNLFEGVLLDMTNNSIVQYNIATSNGSGRHDIQNDNVDASYALNDSSSNIIQFNMATATNGVGYFADAASTGNTFLSNQLAATVIFGAEDLSVGSGTVGTGNTWHDNNHGTSNVFGLLLQ